MSIKAFQKTLAGATVAAVCTLGLPALPAFAITAPTLEISPTVGAGFTALVGNTLNVTATAKDLISAKPIFIGVTQLTGTNAALDNNLTATNLDVGSGTVWVNAQSNASTAVASNLSRSTAEATVSVEAFIDMDASGNFSAGDIQAPAKTIKFIKTADAGLKATLVDVKDGKTVKAEVTSTNSDLNLQILGTGSESEEPKVKFEKAYNSKTNDGFVALGAAASIAWDSTDKVLYSTAAGSPTFSKDYYYQAQAFYTDTTPNPDVDVKLGAVSNALAIDDVEIGATAVTATIADGADSIDSSGKVRAGVKSVLVSGVATSAKAGSHVRVTGSGTAANLKINGTNLDATKAVEVAVGADGKYSFTVTTTTGANNETAALTVKAGATATVSKSLSWATAVATGDLVNTSKSLYETANEVAVLESASYVANIEVHDQFGELLASSATINYSIDGTAGTVSTLTGKATISVPKPASGSTSVLLVDLDRLGGIDPTEGKVTVNFVSGYSTAGYELKNNAGGAFQATLTGVPVVSADASKESDLSNTVAPYGVKVLKVDGTAAVNQKVTFSGAGLGFVKNGRVYPGSVTVIANADGVANVYVVANKTGSASMTVSAGAASKTVDVTVAASALDVSEIVPVASNFSDPASSGTENVTASYTVKLVDKWGNILAGSIAASAGSVSSANSDGTYTWTQSIALGTAAADKTLTVGSVTKTFSVKVGAPAVSIAAPTAVKGASSQAIVFNLKDVNGNAISGKTVTFQVEGAGYLGAGMATSTDANGQIRGTLIIPSTTRGTVVVTATAGDYSVSKTVAVWTSIPTASVKGKTLTVKYSYAAGKTVVLKVDGVVKYTGKPKRNSVYTITKSLKKGSHSVVLTVGGIVLLDKTVTVK